MHTFFLTMYIYVREFVCNKMKSLFLVTVVFSSQASHCFGHLLHIVHLTGHVVGGVVAARYCELCLSRLLMMGVVNVVRWEPICIIMGRVLCIIMGRVLCIRLLVRRCWKMRNLTDR